MDLLEKDAEGSKVVFGGERDGSNDYSNDGDSQKKSQLTWERAFVRLCLALPKTCPQSMVTRKARNYCDTNSVNLFTCRNVYKHCTDGASVAPPMSTKTT